MIVPFLTSRVRTLYVMYDNLSALDIRDVSVVSNVASRTLPSKDNYDDTNRRYAHATLRRPAPEASLTFRPARLSCTGINEC
jgi:hypothetical protein